MRDLVDLPFESAPSMRRFDVISVGIHYFLWSGSEVLRRYCTASHRMLRCELAFYGALFVVKVLYGRLRKQIALPCVMLLNTCEHEGPQHVGCRSVLCVTHLYKRLTQVPFDANSHAGIFNVNVQKSSHGYTRCNHYREHIFGLDTRGTSRRCG